MEIDEIVDVSYHRNGVAGTGFNVVLFKAVMDEDEDTEPRLMVGIVFPKAGSCAVIDPKMCAAGNIRFGENSWRGDVYEPELRSAIKFAEQVQDASYPVRR